MLVILLQTCSNRAMRLEATFLYLHICFVPCHKILYIHNSHLMVACLCLLDLIFSSRRRHPANRATTSVECERGTETAVVCSDEDVTAKGRSS